MEITLFILSYPWQAGNVRKKVNAADDEGLTALHYASRYNHYGVVRQLVEAGGSKQLIFYCFVGANVEISACPVAGTDSPSPILTYFSPIWSWDVLNIKCKIDITLDCINFATFRIFSGSDKFMALSKLLCYCVSKVKLFLYNFLDVSSE